MAAFLLALLLLVPAVADAAGIHPFIRYAYELDGYQGTRVGANEAALIVKSPPPVVLHREAPEARFVFGVMNGNQRTAIEETHLSVTFPPGTRVRADGGWAARVVNRSYSFSLGAINADKGVNADGHLWVTFPGRGEHEVRLEIRARNIAPIARTLRVRFE